jgi:hypothetical protein
VQTQTTTRGATIYGRPVPRFDPRQGQTEPLSKAKLGGVGRGGGVANGELPLAQPVTGVGGVRRRHGGRRAPVGSTARAREAEGATPLAARPRPGAGPTGPRARRGPRRGVCSLRRSPVSFRVCCFKKAVSRSIYVRLSLDKMGSISPLWARCTCTRGVETNDDVAGAHCATFSAHRVSVGRRRAPHISSVASPESPIRKHGTAPNGKQEVQAI